MVLAKDQPLEYSTSAWLQHEFHAADVKPFSLAAQTVFTPSHCPFI